LFLYRLGNSYPSEASAVFGRKIPSTPSSATGIKFNGSEAIKLQEFVINMAIKPNAMADGEVLNMNGGIVIRRTASQLEVIVRVPSDEPEQLYEEQIVAASLGSNEWHEVAVSVENQQLFLKINESEQHINLAKPVLYTGNNGMQLLVSADHTQISNFAFYDWASPALTKFADGSEITDIALNAGGEAVVFVQSQAQLSYNNSKYIAQIKASGGRLPIVLLHEREFSVMAGIFVDAFGVEPTHSQVSALYADQHLYGDPLLSAARLLAKVADDGTLYRESSAIITVLALLNQVEGFDHLVSSIRTLQKFFVTNEKPALVYAAIDNIAKPLQKAVNGDVTALANLELPLTILAEILDDDPDVAKYMSDGIVTAQDLTTWFNHFTKPLDGWVALSYENPAIDATDCNAITKDLFTDTALPMAWKTCRQTGINVANWVRDIAFDNELATNPGEFVNFLRYMNDVIPYAPPIMKKYAYKTQTDSKAMGFSPIDLFVSRAYANPLSEASIVLRPLKWLAKLGAKRGRFAVNFMLGRGNHRIHPLMMLFYISYLENRTDPDYCAKQENSTCKQLIVRDSAEETQKLIESKVKRIAGQILATGNLQEEKFNNDMSFKCTIAAYTHGDMFELKGIALHHIMYELGDASKQIIGIEDENVIYFGEKDKKTGRYKKRKRRTDIVIKGIGDRERTWVELKSMQGASSKLSKSQQDDNTRRNNWLDARIPYWNLINKGNYQKQYLLDNIAVNSRLLNPNDTLPQKFADDFIWWFQTWENTKFKQHKYKGKEYDIDPGVPLDKIGAAGDTGYHRVADRLAEWKPKSRPAGGDNELFESLPQTLIAGFYKAKRVNHTNMRNYHVPTSKIDGINGHAKMFTLPNLAAENEELRTKLETQLEVPPEVEAYYQDVLSYDNEVQTMEDIANRLQELDVIVDAPVEELFDGVIQWTSDLTLFGESECDP
jgi:hypothetical protein